MKKKIILAFIVLFMLSGCVKTTTTTKINMNKSIDFETEVLSSNSLGINPLDTIDQNKLAEKGFNVGVTTDGDYSGIKITKRYSNIDKVSNASGEQVIISDILKGDINDGILYKVEKGFFKNTYYGTFKYKLRSEIFYYERDYKDKIELSEDTLVTLDGEASFKYIVNLPYKAKYSNANETSNGGKTLTWTLNRSEDTDIKYNFTLYNLTHVLIVGIAALIVLFVILYVIIKLIKKHKKENNQNKPIHVDYDPSIEDKLNEFEEIVEEDAPEVANESENNTINNGTFEIVDPNEEKQKVIIKESIIKEPERRAPKFINVDPIEEVVDFGSDEKKEENK